MSELRFRPQRILVVRHAQSEANSGGRTEEPASIPITEIGSRQAVHVANFICERPSRIVVSPYLRTLQTAAPLLQRYPGVPVEQWPISEFTYLDTGVCAQTTYAERQALCQLYWSRCDPLWVDGIGCEAFAGFVRRVSAFRDRLANCSGTDNLVAFTHGLVMRMLLWLTPADREITAPAMADFYSFAQRVSVPNCAIIEASPHRGGHLRLSQKPRTGHIPPVLLPSG